VGLGTGLHTFILYLVRRNFFYFHLFALASPSPHCHLLTCPSPLRPEQRPHASSPKGPYIAHMTMHAYTCGTTDLPEPFHSTVPSSYVVPAARAGVCPLSPLALSSFPCLANPTSLPTAGDLQSARQCPRVSQRCWAWHFWLWAPRTLSRHHHFSSSLRRPRPNHHSKGHSRRAVSCAHVGCRNSHWRAAAVLCSSSW
jgi:hypothetical protein